MQQTPSIGLSTGGWEQRRKVPPTLQGQTHRYDGWASLSLQELVPCKNRVVPESRLPRWETKCSNHTEQVRTLAFSMARHNGPFMETLYSSSTLLVMLKTWEQRGHSVRGGGDFQTKLKNYLNTGVSQNRKNSQEILCDLGASALFKLH